jgi:hypothetical protein
MATPQIRAQTTSDESAEESIVRLFEAANAKRLAIQTASFVRSTRVE